MNNFGMDKEEEIQQRRRLEAMLANMSRQQQASSPVHRQPNLQSQNQGRVNLNQRAMFEAELARARLRTEHALASAIYGTHGNSMLSMGRQVPASPLHLPLPPPSIQLPQHPAILPQSILGLSVPSRYHADLLNQNSSPISVHSQQADQSASLLGLGQSQLGSRLTQESEDSSSMSSRRSNTKSLKRDGQDQKLRSEGSKLSEKERKQHFPLPPRIADAESLAEYSSPKILSLSGFQQKWKIIERQLKTKKGNSKISGEAMEKIKRELFLRSIQKSDMSHLYRRIHGIKTRSNEYGHLSKRPRVARKEDWK